MKIRRVALGLTFLSACAGWLALASVMILQATVAAQSTDIARSGTAVSYLATRVGEQRAFMPYVQLTYTPAPPMLRPTPTPWIWSTAVPAAYSVSPRANWGPYTIRLVRNPQAPLPDAADMNWKGTAGWIEVSKDGAQVDQRLEVRLQNPITDWTRFGLLAEDVNFDSYTDIAVVVDFGAKWGRWEWWLFDARSGLYTQTALSGEISALVWNWHGLDPQARELRAQNFIGTCPIIKVYRVGPEHIMFSRTEGYTLTAQGCIPLTSLPTPTASSTP